MGTSGHFLAISLYKFPLHRILWGRSGSNIFPCTPLHISGESLACCYVDQRRPEVWTEVFCAHGCQSLSHPRLWQPWGGICTLNKWQCGESAWLAMPLFKFPLIASSSFLLVSCSLKAVAHSSLLPIKLFVAWKSWGHDFRWYKVRIRTRHEAPAERKVRERAKWNECSPLVFIYIGGCHFFKI